MGLASTVASGLRRFADVLGKPAFAGTPYPTGGVERPAQLMEELGGTGTQNWGGFIRGEDPNADMDGLTAIRNYDEMRRGDAQVHASLEVIKQPIRTADYEVDPSDPKDPEAVAIAKFVKWNLFERMTTTWDDLIRQALLMLDFGVMLFEKVWSIEEEGEYAGRIVLHKLGPRPPKTLWQWFTDEDGSLLSIKQLSVKAGTYQFLDIPASKLVRFTFQQEGDNFMGISMLRSSYPHWRIKKQLYTIDAIRATRFGVGIPRAKLQPGYAPTRDDRTAIVQMLQAMSSHQHAYVVEPPQVTIDILMPQGTQGGSQVMPSIEHHNEQITRNILAQFLDMGGKSNGGSHALGASAMDFFLNAIESIADQICDTLNKGPVKDLVDMNFASKKYPRVRPTGIQETDVKSMAAAAAALQKAGLLTPDRKTENTFRTLLNLSEIAEDQPTAAEAAAGAVAQPGAAPAPGGVSSPNAPPAHTATPATTQDMPAIPAPQGPHPAQHATTQPAAAHSTATGPSVATPATAHPTPAHTTAAGSAVAESDSPIDVLHHAVNSEGVSMRPAVAADPATPPLDHHPDARLARSTYLAPAAARSTVGGVLPAETSVTNSTPAVSHVRDTVPAVPSNQLPTETDTLPSQPERAHMARSTTIASSGDADEEGAPLSAAASSRQLRQRDRPSYLAPDGVTRLGRRPTALEEQVLDLRELPRRLDTARSVLKNTLLNVREEQILRVASAVAHAPTDASIKTPLVGKMVSDLVKSMRTVYDYGHESVLSELRRQQRSGVRFADHGGPSVALAASFVGVLVKVRDLIVAVERADDVVEQMEKLHSVFELLRSVAAAAGPDEDDAAASVARELTAAAAQYVLLKTRTPEEQAAEIGSLVRQVKTVAADLRTGTERVFRRTDLQHLTASAHLSAQAASDRLVGTARQEALRLRRAGWDAAEIEDALKIHLGELSDADLARIASQEVNEAFSMGRVAAAADASDQIEKAIYSAILDVNTCPVCEELDQQEFAIDSDAYEENMPPNANCEGGDACRCTYIYVLREATDEEDRGLYEGQPRDLAGRFDYGKIADGRTIGMQGIGHLAGLASQGFTYHAVTGEQPTTGYAVSVYKGREDTLDAKDLTAAHLASFATKNWDLLRQKSNFLGGWQNQADGKVYLDISKVTRDKAEATRLGAAHKQLAIFDLAHGESIALREIGYTQRAPHGEAIPLPHGAVRRAADAGRHPGALPPADRADAQSGRRRGGEGDPRDEAGLAAAEGWDESKHPRDDGGRFDYTTTDPVSPTAGGAPGVGGGGVSPTAPTDAAGANLRPDANLLAQHEASAYNAAHGRPGVEHPYVTVDQARAGAIADAFDALPHDDSANPAVREAYQALGREVDQQYAFATAQGMHFEPWRKDGQPYQTSAEMARDVSRNRHLYFYTGGTPNEFMAATDATGLSTNDKFRAVHDYFGHAAGGYGFGPRGEENAWIAHSQMFSPPARASLTTETRGQNSWVNFGRQNYHDDGSPKNIPAALRPFADQKTALLPSEFWYVPPGALSGVLANPHVSFGEWDETKHPRAEDGRWVDAFGNLTQANYAAAGATAAGPATYTPEQAQAEFRRLKDQWATVNNELLDYMATPDAPEVDAKMDQLKDLVKQMYRLPADPGGTAGIGLPGGPRDVVIVGAGAAGLATAVMGGTDGLDTLVVEANAHPGGQAKYSSRVENYPGFPIGTTGDGLAQSMFDQATRVGAEAKLGVRVMGLDYDPATGLKTVRLSNGESVQSRAVVIAGGVDFQKMSFPGAESSSVIYGDSKQLAKDGAGKAVVVVGGSNGAAQAALGAAKTADHVYVVSRSPITKGMSDYQVAALRSNPRITTIENEEIQALHLDQAGKATTVRLKGGRELDAHAVGLFIGGAPNISWVPASIARSGRGKLTVDRDLQTTMPGVFAVGDTREGSIGRIGAAVGDGQMAERNVFEYFTKMVITSPPAAH